MKVRKFLGRAGIMALCAASLSACADKMYFGSELGQSGGGLSGASGADGANGTNGTNGAGGGTGAATATQGPAGPQGATGATGATGAAGAPGMTGAIGATGAPGGITGPDGLASGGLGITGGNGVSQNLLGADPVGGLLNGVLGRNNGVSQITGTPASSSAPGLVPTMARQLQTGTNTSPLGAGLGLTGAGGLVEDLIDPPDPATIALGTSGVVPATIAGGQDGLLGNIIGGPDSKPLLPGVGQAINGLHSEKLLANVHLGVTGAGGVATNLLGSDLAGNAVGNGGSVNGALGGKGLLGSAAVPGLSLGGTVNPVLSAVGGTGPSPLANVLSDPGNPSPAVSVLANVLNGANTSSGVTHAAAPAVTGILNTAAGTGGANSGVLSNVANAVSGLTGGTNNGGLSNITNAVNGLTGGANSGGLSNVTNALSGLTGGANRSGGLLGGVITP